jgi:hypothetical protein
VACYVERPKECMSYKHMCACVLTHMRERSRIHPSTRTHTHTHTHTTKTIAFGPRKLLRHTSTELSNWCFDVFWTELTDWTLRTVQDVSTSMGYICIDIWWLFNVKQYSYGVMYATVSCVQCRTLFVVGAWTHLPISDVSKNERIVGETSFTVSLTERSRTLATVRIIQ